MGDFSFMRKMKYWYSKTKKLVLNTLKDKYDENKNNCKQSFGSFAGEVVN